MAAKQKSTGKMPVLGGRSMAVGGERPSGKAAKGMGGQNMTSSPTLRRKRAV